MSMGKKKVEVKAEVLPPPKVVRIRIEYDDGSVKEAVGDDANAIMEHWNGAEIMLFNHGMQYSGPCLKEIKPRRK